MDNKKIKFWDSMQRLRTAFSKRDFLSCKEILAECKTDIGLESFGRHAFLNNVTKLIESSGIGTEAIKSEQQNENTYSFVTSVFNRFWQLKKTLPENLKTLRDIEGTELVVVDFGGDDSAEIQQFINENFAFDILSGKLKYFIKKVPWEKFHMAPAKNAAARLSTGQYVISLDADNYVTPEDVATFHELLDENAIVHQTTGAAPMRHKDWERYSLYEDNQYHAEQLTWDGSCGRIGSSRKLFETVNGYNENFIGMGMDDIDFIIRSLKASGRYIHSSIQRQADTVFIDNGSAAEEHEHSDNQINWELMDAAISKGEFSVSYDSSVPASAFEPFESECITHSASTDVTLFSSIFRATDYIRRFENDLADIMSANSIPTVILMDVIGSHPEEISQRLKGLANKYKSVFYLPVFKDPGLYACWNIAIKQIKSEYIANLNVDDLRGRGWLDACLRSLKGKVCDISSPVTVPFRDKNINSYSDFLQSRTDGVQYEQWFNCSVKYSFAEGNIHYANLPGGYYDHTNMLQTTGDGLVKSYCIPNASAMWRRAIHETVGYFDEDRYGAYTDLALWMESSFQGYKFKQNSYSALFFLSETQAHMRQDSNYNILLELAKRYGDEDYKMLAVCNQFDLSLNEGSYGDHHLLGWNWVRDNAHDLLKHNSAGIYLDLFIERTFFWKQGDPNRTFIYDKPWIAFVHTTPHNSSSYDLEAQNLDALLKEPRFIQSLECCYGLIVLSQENATYLNKELTKLGYPNIPVRTTFHPNIPINSANREQQLSGTVYHIGWHLRSFSAFAKLNIPKENKVLLIPGNLGKEYFLTEVVNKELAENNLGNIEEYVADMYTADNDEYQDILTNQIVFNHYIQPAGSNLISECISAGACLVINRHPGFESYLGTDYPLFYDNLEQAEKLIKGIVDEPGQRDLVVKHHDVKNEEFSISSFKSELANILQVLVKNS